MIKALLLRLRVDWKEWWYHMMDMNDLRRDRRRILRAIEEAKIRNSIDNRKYYILRDRRGMPGAYNRSETGWLKQKGIIPKDATHLTLDHYAMAVVTSNKVEVKQYTAIHNKMEEE